MVGMWNRLLRQQLGQVAHIPMAVDCRGWERESRHPSMMLAWFNSSESTRTPGPPSVQSTPRLAANPVGKQTGRLGPFPLGQRLLQLAVDWAASRHQARGAGAGAPAGGAHRGRPPPRPDGRSIRRTAIGRERDDPAGPPSSTPAGPRASNSRGALPTPLIDDLVQPGPDPCFPHTPAHGVDAEPPVVTGLTAAGSHILERPIQSVNDPHDLVGRDGQRRHEHHDIAERTQEHALRHSPAHTPRPQRSPGDGGASLIPTMRPGRRISRTAARPATRSPRSDDSWPAQGWTSPSNTSHDSISRRCSSATAAANAFPP